MRTTLLLLVAVLCAGFGPFAGPGAPVTQDARPERTHIERHLPSSHFLYLGYRFYQGFVSPMDGPRCAHYPTCSRYAMEAVRRRGTLLGMLLTLDRLLLGPRSSRLRTLPILRRPGDRPRFYHPLEAETWWLDGIEGDRTWPVP